MSEEREYVDGGFYWVKRLGSWTIGQYCRTEYPASTRPWANTPYTSIHWSIVGEELHYDADDFDEIGPLIGMEPQARAEQEQSE